MTIKMQFLTISYKLLKWKESIPFVHLVNLILLCSILSLWLYVFQFLPPTPPLFSTQLFLPPNPVLFYFYDHFLHYYCMYCTSYYLTTILVCIILSCHAPLEEFLLPALFFLLSTNSTKKDFTSTY